ncbi:ORF6N domain-containing protein [Roseovarius sp. MBR-6]|jgi:phage regulator Rha-like protein|uniref:ORF6N domain-containing protein n=1 Tax=Roseovarius sp. MBR-6 TaxID=3156459 RepID=UPI003399BC5F
MSQTDITLPANIGRSEIHDLPDRPPFMLIREIADVVGIKLDTVQKAFRRHRGQFPEGYYFTLSEAEFSTRFGHHVRTSRGKRTDLEQVAITERGAVLLLSLMTGPDVIPARISLVDTIFNSYHAREAALRREMAIDRQECIGKKAIRQRIAAAAEVGDSYLQLYGRWQHSHRALTAEIEAMRLRGYIAPDALVPPLYILLDLQRKANSIAAEIEDTRQMRLGLEG